MSIERRRVLPASGHPFEALRAEPSASPATEPAPEPAPEPAAEPISGEGPGERATATTTGDSGASRSHTLSRRGRSATEEVHQASGTAVAGPVVQLNARVPKQLRDQIRIAAAQLSITTGNRVSQDQLVAEAVAAHLQALYEAHNGGRPFGL